MKKYLKTVTLLFFLIIVMFSIKVKALEFEPIDEFSINSTPIVELIVNLKLNKKDYSNYKISFFDKFDNSIKLLEKVDEDTLKEVKKVIEDLRIAITDKNVDSTKDLQKKLSDLWNPVAEKLYKTDDSSTNNDQNIVNDFMNQFGTKDNPFNKL